MLKAPQHANKSLKSLTEIRIGTEAPTPKAETDTATTMELKSDLANSALNSLDARKDHKTAMNDAWKGWRSAMAGIVRAGKVQKEHEEIIDALQDMDIHENQELHDVERVEGVRSAMHKENEDVLNELLEVADGAQETL